MLTELNSLAPFIEDNYVRIHVRQYAKLMNLSPPTASKTLKAWAKKGILLHSVDKGYDIYVASRSESFIHLSALYWHQKFTDIGLISRLEKHYFNRPIILYGSLAKGEARKESDVDIAIIRGKALYDLSIYEKKLKRNIQVMLFKNVEGIPKNLINEIMNGYVLKRGSFYGLD